MLQYAAMVQRLHVSAKEAHKKRWKKNWKSGLPLKANFAIHNLLICTSRKGEHQGISQRPSVNGVSQRHITWGKSYRDEWCHESVLHSLPLLPNKNLEQMGNWLELARANHVETVVNSQASCGILKCCGWPRRSSEPSSPTNGSEPQILWGLKDIQQSNNSIQKKSEKENLSDINSKDSFRNLQPLILFAVFVGPIISDSALNALWLELFCLGLAPFWASGLILQMLGPMQGVSGHTQRPYINLGAIPGANCHRILQSKF